MSEEARAGTLANLLGEKVLDAERYPVVRAELEGFSGPRWAPEARLRLRVRDAERIVPVALGVTDLGETVHVTGSFAATHADFGMTPFSVLGGALSVREDLRVRVRLVFDERSGDAGTCAMARDA